MLDWRRSAGDAGTGFRGHTGWTSHSEHRICLCQAVAGFVASPHKRDYAKTAYEVERRRVALHGRVTEPH